MTHRVEIAAGLPYDFVPDNPPLTGHRHWAFATAQLVDDIVGTPLAVPFHVRIVFDGEASETAQDGARVVRRERGVGIKTGADATFALVAQPWLRFTPFAPATDIVVEITADGFEPLRHAFQVVYDQRTVMAPVAAGDHVVVLDASAGLVPGQTLLFGPAGLPRYVRIRGIGAGNQVTLEAGLTSPQNVGDPVFPDAFASPPTERLELRRVPVQIAGRVVRRDTAGNISTPISGASIDVTDFWRTRAAVVASPANGAMTDPNPAVRQFAVALTPGALVSRTAGAVVGDLTLPLAAGDDRELLRSAPAGSTLLDISVAQSLAAPPSPLASRLLLIEPDDPEAAELHTIGALTPSGGPDEPARIALDLPMRHAHGARSRVARINAGPVPAASQVVLDAVAPGDRCVFLDDLAGLAPFPQPPDTALRLTGGGAADEFQRYARLSVRSDADGYFRLPPLQRIARVALTIDDGAWGVQTIEVDPNYGEPEQRLDVVYPV